jgi:glycerol-3-phosphate cytidylyltransferase
MIENSTKGLIYYLESIRNTKIIGFTCSAFDLLHTGHCLMLEDCKKQCDLLICALQTNPNIDRKNKNEPVQTYPERLIMLRNQKTIDYIIKYDTEKDLEDILVLLNPDVRIIGSDWRGKKYTGFDLSTKIHWHDRSNHTYSTSNLRKRVYEREMDKKLDLMKKKEYEDELLRQHSKELDSKSIKN